MATDKLVDFDHVTDYISREAAIEKITALINKSGKYTAYESGADDACYIVEHEISAADVRPVVLCRDCKHFNPYPGDCTDGGIEGVCKRHNSIGVLVMDEDFCPDAERI